MVISKTNKTPICKVGLYVQQQEIQQAQQFKLRAMEDATKKSEKGLELPSQHLANLRIF